MAEDEQTPVFGPLHHPDRPGNRVENSAGSRFEMVFDQLAAAESVENQHPTPIGCDQYIFRRRSNLDIRPLRFIGEEDRNAGVTTISDEESAGDGVHATRFESSVTDCEQFTAFGAVCGKSGDKNVVTRCRTILVQHTNLIPGDSQIRCLERQLRVPDNATVYIVDSPQVVLSHQE